MLCDLSFQAKEARSSPKRRLDGRLSRTSSTEREPAGESESKKQSDENKENWRLDEYFSDQDSWNDSVISGRSLLTADALKYICFTFICLSMYKADKVRAPCQWIMRRHNPWCYLFTTRAWRGDFQRCRRANTGVKFKWPVNICSGGLILGHSCRSLVHSRLLPTRLWLWDWGGGTIKRINSGVAMYVTDMHTTSTKVMPSKCLLTVMKM